MERAVAADFGFFSRHPRQFTHDLSQGMGSSDAPTSLIISTMKAFASTAPARSFSFLPVGTMTRKFPKPLLVLALVSFVAGSASQAALIIEAGFDLFPSTGFLDLDGPGPAPLQAYNGVPFSSFDFGIPFDSQSVGAADTIIERTATLNVPGSSGSIPIEIVGLQLQSAVPYDPDGPGPLPLGSYFATLESRRSLSEGGPGPASTGMINVTETNPGVGGTFNSFFDVYFDLRIGALNGPILGSGLKQFTSGPGLWQRTQPGGSMVPAITGVDYFLNGSNTQADFWVSAPVVHDAGAGTQHIIDPVPEPGTALFGVACLGFVAGRRRRKR